MRGVRAGPTGENRKNRRNKRGKIGNVGKPRKNRNTTKGRRVESGGGSAGRSYFSPIFSYFICISEKTRIPIFFLFLSYFETVAI